MAIDRIDSGPFRLQHPTEFDPARRMRDLTGSPGETGSAGGVGESFGKLLGEAVGDVNGLQLRSQEKINAFVRGEDLPLHEVVLAQEEAEISFRLLLEVRDQLMKAYQEILRTPM